MGLTPLRALLGRHRRIALDSCIFIYYMEANPSYVKVAGEIFAWLESPPNAAVTSTLTMTELLVHPYRSGSETLVNRYYALLSSFPNLEWVVTDLKVADAAARIRALYGLRTPDALQIATAINSGATAFLTNDSILARVPELEVAVIDSLVT